MAKKKIARCEKCGGPRRGPKAHTPECPDNPANRAAGGKRARVSKGGGFMASLRGLDVEELIEIRGQLDALIAAKAPDLEVRIGKLQETLKAIKKL